MYQTAHTYMGQPVAMCMGSQYIHIQEHPHNSNQGPAYYAFLPVMLCCSAQKFNLLAQNYAHFMYVIVLTFYLC